MSLKYFFVVSSNSHSDTILSIKLNFQDISKLLLSDNKTANSLLLDLFSDQTNLVIYSDAKSEVSEIFNKRKIMLEFDMY